MKITDKYSSLTTEELLRKEWSSRKLGKLFSCPSCGGIWYTHCHGCLLAKAIQERHDKP